MLRAFSGVSTWFCFASSGVITVKFRRAPERRSAISCATAEKSTPALRSTLKGRTARRTGSPGGAAPHCQYPSPAAITTAAAPDHFSTVRRGSRAPATSWAEPYRRADLSSRDLPMTFLQGCGNSSTRLGPYAPALLLAMVRVLEAEVAADGGVVDGRDSVISAAACCGVRPVSITCKRTPKA